MTRLVAAAPFAVLAAIDLLMTVWLRRAAARELKQGNLPVNAFLELTQLFAAAATIASALLAIVMLLWY